MVQQTKIDAAYNKGFSDGLSWVADRLREAAEVVEKTAYADFQRRDGNGTRTFQGIAKIGQVHFATQLRNVATEIESAIQKAESDGT